LSEEEEGFQSWNPHESEEYFLILEVPFYYLDTNIGVTRLEPDAKNYDCRYKQWSGQDYGYFRHHVRSGEERD
jgi:hypothetical protein